MFQTRCKCFKHVANVHNTFIIFKTRFKYLKRVANICTALNPKRVANSRKKKSGKYQPPYMIQLIVICLHIWQVSATVHDTAFICLHT